MMTRVDSLEMRIQRLEAALQQWKESGAREADVAAVVERLREEMDAVMQLTLHMSAALMEIVQKLPQYGEVN